MIEVNTWFIQNWLKPVFRKNCLLGDHDYYNSADFEVTEALEAAYPRILGEFYNMQERIKDFAPFHTISPDQTYISNDEKWKMFFLKAGNVRFQRNCQEFPLTMALLDQYPEVVSAYFSVIGPKKMLMPHEGPWSGILRMHLGILVPQEGKGCVLVNNQKEYRWKAGEVVVFDDTFEHFAVNATDKERVVLFLDVLRPLPWFWHTVNKSILYMARFLPYFRTPIRRHRAWEKEFYGEA